MTSGAGTVDLPTADATDSELLRRFGTPFAQRALFAGLTKAFQPRLTLGFTGAVVLGLTRDAHATSWATADVWTTDIGRKSASATLACEGRVLIEGDLIAAVRLTEIFGGGVPVDSLS